MIIVEQPTIKIGHRLFVAKLERHDQYLTPSINECGEVLYAQPGREETATEKELREFINAGSDR